MRSILVQAESYRRFAQRKCNAHYLLAEKNKNKHTLLGVFVTLFSTIVGTAIFASISEQNSHFTIQIITGFLSVLAAVLSAFLTFFRFSEKSEMHKSAANAYEALRHKLDIFLLKNIHVGDTPEQQDILEELENISLDMNKIAETAPTVPDKVWDSIKDKINMKPIYIKEERPNAQ